MRIGKLVGVATGAAAVALVVATPGMTRSQTTNAPAILTIKVTIGDSAITMRPSSAARGTNCIFVLTNRGKRTQRWVLGTPRRGQGKTIGFATNLTPDQQKTIVMFLDYRGLLPYSSSAAGGRVLKGTFRIL
jgi:hypothetical protein